MKQRIVYLKIFSAACAYLRGNFRARLATQRKSLGKFNLRPLASTCRKGSFGQRFIVQIGPCMRSDNIGRKSMFHRSIKQRKSVFYCLLPHYLYIIKQMKKPKPCITLGHLRTIETLAGGSCFLHFPRVLKRRRVLSQCNTAPVAYM